MRNYTGLGSNAGNGARLAFTPPPADWNDVRLLAANTAKRHTIPAGARYVSFSASDDFWCLFGDSGVTAAIPATDITDGTASELSPAAREIPPGATHISLIAPGTVTVVLSFYGSA